MNDFHFIGDAITYAVNTYGVNYKHYVFIVPLYNGMYRIVESSKAN